MTTWGATVDTALKAAEGVLLLAPLPGPVQVLVKAVLDQAKDGLCKVLDPDTELHGQADGVPATLVDSRTK